MQSDLLGAHAMGVRNVLLTTGRPRREGTYAVATAVFDVDAIGLANMVAQLNRGLDIGGQSLGAPTRFHVGVGGQPVLADARRRMAAAEYKVQAGAEFLMTPPILDLDAFDASLQRLRGAGLPILAGVVALESLRQAEFLASEVPGRPVPRSRARPPARPRADQAAEGLAITRELVDGLRTAGSRHSRHRPARVESGRRSDGSRGGRRALMTRRLQRVAAGGSICCCSADFCAAPEHRRDRAELARARGRDGPADASRRRRSGGRARSGHGRAHVGARRAAAARDACPRDRIGSRCSSNGCGRRWPQVDCVCASAAALQTLAAERGLLPIDHIVSGLPFASLPAEVTTRILDSIEESLRTNGTFTTFQYVHAYRMRQATAFRRELSDRLGSEPRRTLVMRNLPPAYVLTWTRARPSGRSA